MKKILLLAASLLTGMAVYAYQPTANPTAPEWPADQVKAVYSDTYGADCEFGEWGSGTTYTQEEYGKKFVTTSLGYFGLTFDGMNCSKMEKLHLDIFADGTSEYTIRVVPGHGGTEVGVTIDVCPGDVWTSINIPLSAFSGVSNWTNVYQIKIDNAAERTFWLNNIYFYTEQEPEEDPEAPTNFTILDSSASYFTATIEAQAEDNSGVVIFEVYDGENLLAKATGVSGVAKTINVGGLKANTNYAFTVKAKDESDNYAENEESVNITTLTAPAPAAAPTYSAAKVLSIYCDEYEQAKTWEMGAWGQSTVMTEGELAEGELAQHCSNSNYMGWEFKGEPASLDCSNMDKVRFDVWVASAGSIQFSPIWGSESLKQYTLEAGWNTIEESLDSWTGINKANIYQLKWTNMPSECFIDNVLFYKAVSTTSVEVTIPECGFATLCSDHQLKIPDDVRVFYYNTYEDKTRTLFSEQVPDGEVLQKKTGYVVKATPGTYEFEFDDAATAYKVENNLLQGAAGEDLKLEFDDQLKDQKIYVLGTIEGKTAFYRYTGYVIPAGKAFYVMDGVQSNTERLDDTTPDWIWTRE